MHAETAWKSSDTVHTYILVLNEVLWMVDNMDHYLVNPNHQRHCGNKVQYNPMSADPLSIITEENKLYMEISMDSTVVYAKTHYPTKNELQTFPHIMLLSPHNWNPNAVWFQKSSKILNAVVGSMKFVSAVTTLGRHHQEEEDT